ncbi:putative mediator of RNA polymerase II transcription subunit 10b-like protein isoform 1 [Tanacetum coccineum]|uniref:Mediator of RNA polymerase II transcription subunit 10b-like protein isoform 1 n=1 Tax=Tanacetum coccineum TaxID=301880 RepID=A0ABQ4WLY1_9ASTR
MEVAATSSLPSPSLWSSLNSWFTSTVLFILLNLMIATILFTSNLPQNNQPPQQEQEANNDDKDQQKETEKQKQPSILTRIKSFTFEQNHHDDQDDVLDHHAQQPIEYVFNQPMHYQHFDFDQPTETIATHYDFNAKYSGEVVSGADKFSGEFSDEVQDIETEDTLLDSEPTHEEILDANGVEDEFESMDDVYSKVVDSKKSKKMKKSTSLKVGFKDDFDDDVAALESRRPDTVRVKKVMMVEEDDDDDGVEVDSRADDFINKFKNDLKLQRIESIMKKGGNKP